MNNPFRYFNSSPEVIRLAVMIYVKYPLSLRNVEDLLAERGIEISHETIRFWWNRFGPMFAAEIRKKRVARMHGYIQWRWHLDEVFVKINGKLRYLWRAVDHEGEVLETVVTVKRDESAARRFLKRLMKRNGRPRSVVTDGLCSYSAAMKEIGGVDRHEVGRSLNNRAENSHQPFRRRERAMQRFRSIKTLQEFACGAISLVERPNRSAPQVINCADLKCGALISAPMPKVSGEALETWLRRKERRETRAALTSQR
jgi:putative transposase